MRSGNFFSQSQKTREILGELVRMWQQVGKSRAGAIDQASKDLGLACRKGKRILYDEPHSLSLREELNVESRAESAWLKIADVARQTAEYCEAQAELNRIRKRQCELDLGGVGCSKFTSSPRKSQPKSSQRISLGKLNALLYAAPIGGLCAALIG